MTHQPARQGDRSLRESARSLLRRGVAGIVLVVAVLFLLKLAIGVAIGIFTTVATIVVVLAVIVGVVWALKNI